ncbi:MAG: hypothetical protein ABWY64_27315 [Tardiphaga sp.]
MSFATTVTIKVAPAHSIFFISDPAYEVVSKVDGRTPTVWATPSCLAVGCLMFQDGETELTLLAGEEADRAAPLLVADREMEQVFEGSLETPGNVLVVSTSEKQVLLRLTVPSVTTRVRVWTNHPTEPEKITVLAG